MIQLISHVYEESHRKEITGERKNGPKKQMVPCPLFLQLMVKFRYLWDSKLLGRDFSGSVGLATSETLSHEI